MQSRTDNAIVTAHHALHVAGLSDLIWGHAALRLPDGSGIVTKAAGWGFEEINLERLVHVDWAGRRTAGHGDVHIEVPIHLQIMAARPEIMCVVHTHAPSVTAFASLVVPMRAISHSGVPFAEHLPRFTGTGNLINTQGLGDAVADELGDAAAILLPRHGMVSVGATPAEAVMRSVLLDRAAREYLAAAAAGGPHAWSDEHELQQKSALVWSSKQIDAGYRYLERRVAMLELPGAVGSLHRESSTMAGDEILD